MPHFISKIMKRIVRLSKRPNKQNYRPTRGAPMFTSAAEQLRVRGGGGGQGRPLSPCFRPSDAVCALVAQAVGTLKALFLCRILYQVWITLCLII